MESGQAMSIQASVHLHKSITIVRIHAAAAAPKTTATKVSALKTKSDEGATKDQQRPKGATKDQKRPKGAPPFPISIDPPNAPISHPYQSPD